MQIETTDTTYRIDGREFPRVTSVLGIVRPDLKEIPADVLAQAAARGRAVHKGVWALCGGGGGLYWPSVQAELVPYLRAFEAAQAALGFTVIGKEQLVVSAVFGYAGRADLIVEWGGRFGILDLKTSAEPHPAYRLQVSAYVEAYRETSGTRKRLHRWILYLKGTGRYRLDACEDTTHEADFKVFTNVLAAWRWLQAQNGRKAA
ncbi:MAG: PD-(D/E)XK nuclease family protein [Candidatus Methylomirabilales bacterium]